jgi:hypothetical protein
MTLIKKKMFMKLGIVIEAIFCCILTVGCAETVQQQALDKQALDKSLINSELVNTFNDIAMQNAIISQHTLFPYHFIKNGVELNELGQRDLCILAKHFEENPGHLNVRRNRIPSDLYESRVKLVLERLKEAGIDTERIRVTDDMPGGSGMPSERILIILEGEHEARSRTNDNQL